MTRKKRNDKKKYYDKEEKYDDKENTRPRTGHKAPEPKREARPVSEDRQWTRNTL